MTLEYIYIFIIYFWEKYVFSIINYFYSSPAFRVQEEITNLLFTHNFSW